MSLKVRLTIAVVAVACLGMVAVAAVTYAEQRSFLYDRADEQAERALGPVLREMIAEHAGRPDRGGPGGPPLGGGMMGGPGGGRGPKPEPGGAPSGTYGAHRDVSGRVVESVVLSFEQNDPPAPDLPTDLEPGEERTIDALRGDLEYRAVVHPLPFGRGDVVVAVPLESVQETLDRLLLVEALVIGAALIALTLLAALFVRVGLHPLDRIGRTADAVAAGDLSQRVTIATSRTEVGRLGIALNEMLDRLQEAFAEREASENRLRRFLADASHELRTPLASIRGYAEVFRMGAATDPADTEKAMRRIEQESARMGVLVEDVLALARLDEQRRAGSEEVDLARLAADAADDARATHPERPIELHAGAPAVVHGDPGQLRQVMANLVRNALVHTPPGTRIEIAAARDSDVVRLEVRDHGAGLPGDDPSVLFERFWRAEGGRERGRAGAGLGLAIVAAIVAVHQGRVSASDAPDGGARFVVELPLSADSQGLPSGVSAR